MQRIWYYTEIVNDRHWSVYQKRVVEGLTLKETAEIFEVSPLRIAQMVAKCQRALAAKEERLNAAHGTIGSMMLPYRLKNAFYQLLGDDWRDVLLLDFFRNFSKNDLMAVRSMGNKTINDSHPELKRVAGEDALKKWWRGETV